MKSLIVEKIQVLEKLTIYTHFGKLYYRSFTTREAKMKVLVGQRRYVILIGSKAIKVARIRPWESLKLAWQLFKKDELGYHLVINEYENKDTIPYYFVAGIVSNIHEFREEFFRKGHPYSDYLAFVAPTTSSFLGFFNFQDRVEPVPLTEQQWQEFINYVIPNVSKHRRHEETEVMLRDKKKFGVLNGKLVYLSPGQGMMIDQDMRDFAKVMGVCFVERQKEVKND